MFKNKRGVEVWISYIFLILVTVVLSYMVFTWLHGYSKESVEKISQKVNTEKCDRISFFVADSFIKNPGNATQTLYIKVTNNGYLRINKIILRKYLDTGINVNTINAYMKPDETKEIDSDFQGFIEAYEIIPVYMDNSAEVICNNRKVQKKYNPASDRFEG
jgi:hypothetical protein